MEFFARMLQQALNVAESLDVLQRKTGIAIAERPVLATADEYSSLPDVATGCALGWLRCSVESPSFCVTQIPSIDRSHSSGFFLEREEILGDAPSMPPPNDIPSVRRYHRHTLV